MRSLDYMNVGGVAESLKQRAPYQCLKQSQCVFLDSMADELNLPRTTDCKEDENKNMV